MAGSDRGDGSFDGGLPKAIELTDVKKVTVVETLWPLPLLLSVSVEAGWRRQTDWRWLAATDGGDGSVDKDDALAKLNDVPAVFVSDTGSR